MTEPPRLPSIVFAMAAWSPAFAILGTALGVLLYLTGQASSVGVVALRVAGLGLVVGAFVGWLDQRAAKKRPALPDQKGQLRHHGDAWVLVTPLVVAGVGFAALVVLATVQAESVLLGGGFVAASVLCIGFVRPVWTRMRLARAAEAYSVGDRAAAAAAYRGLLTHLLCTRPGRVQAHLNLGLSSMLDGQLSAAEHHYSQVALGAGVGFAQTGIALVRTLKGDFKGAEAAVGAAASAGRAVQSEVDGVRLLLVLRRDGAAAAVALAERLNNDKSGSLFLGVYAAACRLEGQLARSEALLERGVASALSISGLDRIISELDPDGVASPD